MPDGGVAPVRVEARSWGWRHAGRRRWALHDLDLTIEPGERVLLLGASGAGKSTLLAGLAGVLGGDDEGEQRGALLLDGVPAARRRGTIGLVLQDPDSQTIMSRIGDDVAFGCENLGVPRDEIWDRVTESLANVGLDLPVHHPSSALSGGQRQRLAIAGVLAMRPGLILLDEPTANLDPAGAVDVRDTVVRSAKRTGATVIIVEHRVEAWLPVVDRIIVIGDGGVIADGAPDLVLASQGERLVELGIWVPGASDSVPRRRAARPGASLLRTVDLFCGRRSGPTVDGGRQIDIAEGTITALTGANGSGKTTLALTLSGLLPPISGSVGALPLLSGTSGPDPVRWKSRDLLGRIGMVFQDPEHQFIAPTVRQELAVGPTERRLSTHAIQAIVDDLLPRLRLDHLAEANPFTLSGGEKRRLSVATSLATSPQLLVLDEPTFGQDARTWRELVELLDEQRASGTAIVMASHDVDLVSALADDDVRLAVAGEVLDERR